MTSEEPGLRFCPRCAAEHPVGSCRVVRLGHEDVPLCPRCGMVTRAVRLRRRASLPEVYRAALRYPLQPDARITLMAVSLGAYVASFLPLVGELVAGGLVLTSLSEVVRHSVAGHDDLPHPTDFTDWLDLLRPMARCGLVLLVAAGPWLAVTGLVASPSLRVPLQVLAGTWCLAYLPGALGLAALREGWLVGVNPVPVVALVMRIPRDYALTVGVLFALLVPTELMFQLTAALTPRNPVLALIVEVAGTTVALGPALLMARLLGLLLRERAEEIGLDP